MQLKHVHYLAYCLGGFALLFSCQNDKISYLWNSRWLATSLCSAPELSKLLSRVCQSQTVFKLQLCEYVQFAAGYLGIICTLRHVRRMCAREVHHETSACECFWSFCLFQGPWVHLSLFWTHINAVDGNVFLVMCRHLLPLHAIEKFAVWKEMLNVKRRVECFLFKSRDVAAEEKQSAVIAFHSLTKAW